MSKVLAPNIYLSFITKMEARIRSRAKSAKDKTCRVIATDFSRSAPMSQI